VEESVEGGITIALSSHETSNGERRGLTSEYTLLINMSDVHLNSGMILSVEDSVSSRALSRNIEVDELALIVLKEDDVPEIKISDILAYRLRPIKKIIVAWLESLSDSSCSTRHWL
jgi:hypothetical protein